MIIPTLTKLLENKIVANNLLGFFKISLICFSFFSSISFSSSKLDEFKEKKETSEPEISADKKIKIDTINNPIIEFSTTL